MGSKRNLLALTVVATGLVAWVAGIGTAFGGKSGGHGVAISAAAMVDRAALVDAAQTALPNLPTPEEIMTIPNANQRLVMHKIVELTELATWAEQMTNAEFEAYFNEFTLVTAAVEAGISLAANEFGGVLGDGIGQCEAARNECYGDNGCAATTGMRCACCPTCNIPYLQCLSAFSVRAR